ncbi:MAG: glycine cleavage system aminomethyltransferase GcvT [Candidatus Brocadiia bacterium]
MNRTPLHDRHEQLNARMVDFEGWRMPLQYEGILQEHRHTRETACVFDTCHMSQFRVEGDNAGRALSEALACRITSLGQNRCRYGFILNRSGGIIDDIVCYRTGSQSYLIVGNAGTRNQVAEVLRERLSGRAECRDVSDDTAKIDLQGPGSAEVVEELYPRAAQLDYFEFFSGESTIISRTGYTGELGYEFYVPSGKATTIWDHLLDRPDVRPAGLGARDTLRLEAGLPLYGHELDESTTPLEAGYGGFLPDQGGYVGADAIEQQKRNGIEVSLVGIQFEGRRAARPDDDLLSHGEVVGSVTSGAFGPSVGCAIAMAYLEAGAAGPGQEVQAAVRSHRITGTTTEMPFYRNGTVQTSL